jgi:hypothetical protein
MWREAAAERVRGEADRRREKTWLAQPYLDISGCMTSVTDN